MTSLGSAVAVTGPTPFVATGYTPAFGGALGSATLQSMTGGSGAPVVPTTGQTWPRSA
jgi:hypothetical protein